METTPESFATQHNMMLPDGVNDDSTAPKADQSVANDAKTAPEAKKPNGPAACLFSIDLGRMRSLRLFSSNPEGTCGQLVIASPEAQYKILHFHHGGLDKLAQIFEQWSLLRSKSPKSESPAPHALPFQQFANCSPKIGKSELNPEEGLYDMVRAETWRSYANANGVVEDSSTLTKLIFFGGLDPALRRKIWPFLLCVYPWNSSQEQREAVRNDLFLEYQNIRKKRHKAELRKSLSCNWPGIESSVSKDVVRTDRNHPYYEGEDNVNVEIMRNVLLNYAAFCPALGYIQGMSDLLSPILAVTQNEADAFWCFAGLMQRTVFVCTSTRAKRDSNSMERNLELLRGLLKVMYPAFYNHMVKVTKRPGEADNRCDSPSAALLNNFPLLFAHRWVLLCFKREFEEKWALRVWECCWSCRQTPFFHLFVCLAILMCYGGDVLAQNLCHDEVLLYFSSLAQHMDAPLVLKKARGLLYQFMRRDWIPCYLAEVCDQDPSSGNSKDLWDNDHIPHIKCLHDNQDNCPYIAALGSE